MGRLKIHQSSIASPSPSLAWSFGALLCAGQAIACSNDHAVSPWGGRAMPPLSAFIESPDLARSLHAIEVETRHAGLQLLKAVPARGRDGTDYEVRSYEGKDSLGRPAGAVRVASPWGVVLALGPLDEADEPRPTRYLPVMLAGEAAIVFPADLTGDGNPEVVLQSDRNKQVAIYSLAPRGATELRIDLAHPPLELRLAVKGYALWTRRAPVSGVLTPKWERIATYQAGVFSENTDEARAFHRIERDRRVDPPDGETPSARLTRTLDRVFHAARAEPKPGDPKAKLDGLARESVPPDLTEEWRACVDELSKELASP